MILRRTLKLTWTVFLLLLPLRLGAQEAAPAAVPVAIRAAWLIDGKSNRRIENAVVLVEGQRIKAVGSGIAIPAGARVIDLGEATLLPGLIDVHTHLLTELDPHPGPGGDLSEVLKRSTTERALLGVRTAREMLQAGFTTVRDVGNSGMDGDVALREAIERGWVTGPRILACTRALAPPGGQFTRLQHEAQGLIEHEYAIIAGVDWARRAVRQALYDGADCIKVIVDHGPNTLPVEELRAIVDEAHRAKRKVAAHAIRETATRIAAEAGVDSIEHGYLVPDDVLKIMARKRIFLVPTDIYPPLTPDLTPEQRKKLQEMVEKGTSRTRDRLRRARAIGVPIAAGSDAYVAWPGVGRGQASVRVLEEYVQAGLSPADVLRAATVGAAELLGMQDRIGSIEPNKLADLIAVPGNPLQDVKELRRVRFVMKAGQVVHTDGPGAGGKEGGALRSGRSD